MVMNGKSKNTVSDILPVLASEWNLQFLQKLQIDYSESCSIFEFWRII